MEASEELRKNKEYAKQLLQLLKMACQERDEARDELQKLMNKVMLSAEFFNGIPQLQPDSPSPPPPPPLLKPTKANSSITESNSHSETYNYHSHGSSPGDSFFDAVSSPELSNINMADSSNIAAFVNQPLVQECKSMMVPNNSVVVPSGIQKIDQASLVIDSLAKGKSLPQRGNFLKAVLDSGPLLQNLLVAGPLPRWRNPPQLQTFHIPPVSIKGCTSDADIIMNQKTSANLNQFASRFQTQTPRPYAEMSCASSQIMSTSMLNFANGPAPGAFMSSDMLISAGANANTYAALGKRHRLH